MMKCFKRNGKIYTLVYKHNLQSELNYISWTQGETEIFLNVSVKPYKGREYNPEKVCWIIQG